MRFGVTIYYYIVYNYIIHYLQVDIYGVKESFSPARMRYNTVVRILRVARFIDEHINYNNIILF